MEAGLILWVVIGLTVGLGLASGKIVKGGRFGPVMSSVLGTAGAVGGGWLASMLSINVGLAGGLIVSIGAAMIGASFMIWITGTLKIGLSGPNSARPADQSHGR